MDLSHVLSFLTINPMKLVVLTGAGISAESGIQTFRDSNGLWEGFDVMQVASIDGWHKNPALVLDFYNQRRKQCQSVSPNAAHFALAAFEAFAEVTIITQNVDNLHELAGSSHVIHLHGELAKVRSSGNPNYLKDISEVAENGWEIKMGDVCPDGHQLRPHIVWFGEIVDAIETAAQEVDSADVVMVIGTSLQVYPAAGLLEYVGDNIPKFIIDKNIPNIPASSNLTAIEESATIGVPKALEMIKNQFS